MQQLSSAFQSMRSSGLHVDDMVRLAWLKYEVQTGKRSEITIDSKRLAFFRYLFEHGWIHAG